MVRHAALKHSTHKKRETSGAPAAADAHPSRAKHPAHSLDRLIHERMRLGIISALAANESLTFNDLKQLMHTTDGNLSVHARKLEDGGYIACTKSFEGRLPKTEYKLTAAGKRALENYVSHMETLIKQVRNR
ncbi:MAG TPA: transcriptional regulator [Pyrinomonadaceae bacterium]|nr:transcriptional regulator [Pyrinomonadaceae bacterium]